MGVTPDRRYGPDASTSSPRWGEARREDTAGRGPVLPVVVAGYVRGVSRRLSPIPTPAFELVESKLHAPLSRPGIVARTELVDRLVAAHDTPPSSPCRPAGYGKTTLLAQWAEHKQPRVGWLTTNERDNDPVVLLAYLATALDRVEAIDPNGVRRRSHRRVRVEVSRRLVSAMAPMRQPVTLVISITSRRSRTRSASTQSRHLARPACRSPAAIASRNALPLPRRACRARRASSRSASRTSRWMRRGR